MLEINLLPKEYRKRKFRLELEKNALLVIGAGLAALIILASYSVFFQVIPARALDKKIAAARAENQNYEREIKLVNALTDQKNLIIARMSTIEVLDHDREVWVNVIADLGSRVPDYLWLVGVEPATKGATDAQATSRQTSIKGKSYSINSLATFLIRLKKSPYLNNVSLISIRLVEEQLPEGSGSYESYHFTINCDLTLSSTEETQTEKMMTTGKLAAGSEF
jgi:Tfp pilus assembly protein PilN